MDTSLDANWPSDLKAQICNEYTFILAKYESEIQIQTKNKINTFQLHQTLRKRHTWDNAQR